MKISPPITRINSTKVRDFIELLSSNDFKIKDNPIMQDPGWRIFQEVIF